MGLQRFDRDFLGFAASSMLAIAAETCIYLGYVKEAVAIGCKRAHSSGCAQCGA